MAWFDHVETVPQFFDIFLTFLSIITVAILIVAFSVWRGLGSISDSIDALERSRRPETTRDEEPATKEDDAHPTR